MKRFFIITPRLSVSTAVTDSPVRTCDRKAAMATHIAPPHVTHTYIELVFKYPDSHWLCQVTFNTRRSPHVFQFLNMSFHKKSRPKDFQWQRRHTELFGLKKKSKRFLFKLFLTDLKLLSGVSSHQMLEIFVFSPYFLGCVPARKILSSEVKNCQTCTSIHNRA